MWQQIIGPVGSRGRSVWIWVVALTVGLTAAVVVAVALAPS